MAGDGIFFLSVLRTEQISFLSSQINEWNQQEFIPDSQVHRHHPDPSQAFRQLR